jgi:hypothetical protein
MPASPLEEGSHKGSVWGSCEITKSLDGFVDSMTSTSVLDGVLGSASMPYQNPETVLVRHVGPTIRV